MCLYSLKELIEIRDIKHCHNITLIMKTMKENHKNLLINIKIARSNEDLFLHSL